MDYKEKRQALVIELRRIFTENNKTCLWFSGGSDSLFLLNVLLSLKLKFGVLRFDDGLNKQQRKITDDVITEYNLQVFSYPPIFSMLVGKDGELSLVSYYSINEKAASVPVVRDLVNGGTCAFDLKIEKPFDTHAPIEFDAHIWGTRFEDSHYSLEQNLKNENWMVGGKQFFAPLAYWTKQDVIEGLKSFGIEYEQPSDELNTGNIVVCSNCLKGNSAFCPKLGKEIESVKWNQNQNLQHFQLILHHSEK